MKPSFLYYKIADSFNNVVGFLKLNFDFYSSVQFSENEIPKHCSQGKKQGTRFVPSAGTEFVIK